MNQKQLGPCTSTLLSHCPKKSLTSAPMQGRILEVPIAGSCQPAKVFTAEQVAFLQSDLSIASLHVCQTIIIQTTYECLVLCEASKNHPQAIGGSPCFHNNVNFSISYHNVASLCLKDLTFWKVETASYSSQILSK